jgi:hypothetical protein
MVSDETLVGYKDLLVYIVENCKEFTMDVHISVVRSLRILGNAEASENSECHDHMGWHLGDGEHVRLLGRLVKNTALGVALLCEILHSVVKLLRCNSCDVGIIQIRRFAHLFEILYSSLIEDGRYFSKYHTIPSLLELLNAFHEDLKGRVILSAKKALMRSINEERNRKVVSRSLHLEILSNFDDTLFPECDFNKEMSMILCIINLHLDGTVKENRVFEVLGPKILVGIISHSRLTYRAIKMDSPAS